MELKKRKKRLKVQPGKSIKCHDLDEASDIDAPEECENNEDNENEISTNNVGSIREDELQCSSSSLNKTGQMPIDILKDNIDEGTWLAVNYGRKKAKLFFGKVTKVIRKGYIYEGSFTRQKKSTLPKMHVFPDVKDFCEFLLEDVVRIVSPPKYLRRGVLEFNTSIDDIIKTMK